MIGAVIVEDDQIARKALINIIHEVDPDIHILGEAGTVDGAIKIIQAKNPDLLFLDIRLNRGTGFDILNKIDASQMNVIFTTAYSEFAIKAIKYSAIDYLLKPIDPQELKEALSKIKSTLNTNVLSRLQVLEEIIANPPSIRKMILSEAKGFKVVDIEEIVRCEGERNYTTFYLLDGSSVVTSKPLIEYERLLDPSIFMRIHKSHIISLIHVDAYIKGRDGKAVMKDGTKVPISREKRTDFVERMRDKSA